MEDERGEKGHGVRPNALRTTGNIVHPVPSITLLPENLSAHEFRYSHLPAFCALCYREREGDVGSTTAVLRTHAFEPSSASQIAASGAEIYLSEIWKPR